MDIIYCNTPKANALRRLLDYIDGYEMCESGQFDDIDAEIDRHRAIVENMFEKECKLNYGTRQSNKAVFN